MSAARYAIPGPGLSVAGVVAEHARTQPDATAVTFLERGETVRERVSYAALDAEARRVAALLEARDLAGERALLVMPAGAAFLGALLGCLYAGTVAIPVPMPRRGASAARLDAIAARSRAAAVVAAGAGLPCLTDPGADGARCGGLPVIGMDDPGPDGATARCRGLSPPDGRDVVHQYTSGSTREPRGVRWDDACILANARLVDHGWRFRERPVLVNWLPHYHDMGLMGGLLVPLLFGASSVQLAPLDFVQKPVRWLRAISDHGGQVSGGPSFAYELCLRMVRDDEIATLSLDRWDRAFCGAEAVHRETLARFEARFSLAGLRAGSTFACYGLAEATLFVAGDPAPASWWAAPTPAPAADPDARAPCRLNPATAATLRIVDPVSLRAVDANGAEGEIWVDAPSVARGYDGDPASDAVFAARLVPDDGRRYLRTGDVGTIDGDMLVVTGRLKDVLLVNGVNVAASDVEWLAAHQHAALNPYAAAAVHVGALDQGDAALVIELVGKAPPALDGAAVVAAIRGAALMEHGVTLRIVRVVPRGTLPRTTSGKIQRHLVRHALQQEGLAAADAWPASGAPAAGAPA